MIAFLLSMPHVASWNNRWSGEGKIYARLRKDNEVPSEYVDQSFEYRWDDGWGASVEVRKVDSKEAAKIRKQSAGFYGYDWMIDSIIDHGRIITPEDFISEEGTDEQKLVRDICGTVGASHDKNFTTISRASVTLKSLTKLVENNLIDESLEIYSGGPTIEDVLRFMTKYSEDLYMLEFNFKDSEYHFTEMCRNHYSKLVNPESEEELAKLLRGATPDKDPLGYPIYTLE